jgi:serine/threonine protein kinase
VAVKIFASKTGVNWLLLQQEIERLIRLDKHPNVVSLLDADLACATPFYAMEFMEAGSLEGFVDPLRPVPPETAARWMEEIGQALSFVHSKGIIHCDIKPANILLDAEGRVRVADFGQSRFLTDSAGALGTLFFMAPEQVHAGDEEERAQPDQRWDIYALGATVHALLTGQAPHATKENRERLQKTASISDRLRTYAELVRTEPISDWTTGAGTPVDEELAALAGQCLSFDPARRQGSVSQVIGDLQARRENRPVSALSHRKSYVFSKFLKRTVSSAGIPALLASAALLLLLGALIFRALLISVLQDEMIHGTMDSVEILSADLARGLDQDSTLPTFDEYDIMQRLLRDSRIADLVYLNRDGSVRWHPDPGLLAEPWDRYARGSDSPKTDAVFQTVRDRASRIRRVAGHEYWEVAIPVMDRGSPPAVVALVVAREAVLVRVREHMTKYWLSALGLFFAVGLLLVCYVPDLRANMPLVLGSGLILLLTASTVFLFRVRPADERPETPDVGAHWLSKRGGLKRDGAELIPGWSPRRLAPPSPSLYLRKDAIAHYQRGDLAAARSGWQRVASLDPRDPQARDWLTRIDFLPRR